MNRSEFDEQLARQLRHAQQEVLAIAHMQTTHRKRMQQIAAAVAMAEHEPSIYFTPMKDGASFRANITLYQQPNFKIFERIANTLDLFGFPVEAWRTEDDNSGHKRRNFVFASDSVEINLDIWLVSGAACELVEKERIPQPDKITYELRCGDDKS